MHWQALTMGSHKPATIESLDSVRIHVESQAYPCILQQVQRPTVWAHGLECPPLLQKGVKGWKQLMGGWVRENKVDCLFCCCIPAALQKDKNCGSWLPMLVGDTFLPGKDLHHNLFISINVSVKLPTHCLVGERSPSYFKTLMCLSQTSNTLFDLSEKLPHYFVHQYKSLMCVNQSLTHCLVGQSKLCYSDILT